MHDSQVLLNRKIWQGRAMLGLGLLLLLVGIGVRLLAPASVMNFKWAEAFGILLLGTGGTFLARYELARRSPQAARQVINEDLDERSTLLRNQAGNTAFVISFTLASIGLIIYSLMTQGQPADLLWWWMAFLVIAPSAVYVGYLVWLNQHS